jgi:hypothetical protein
VKESLEAALSEDARPGGKRTLTGSEEALVIATACSTPPKDRPWRGAKVTPRRTAVDFATWMRELIDGPYAAVDRLQVVLDNLSTHTPAAFYEGFTPAEARRVLRKLEFHDVPKHASWLNMVEIEIGVLATQCLARRIPDVDTLTTVVDAWRTARNDAGAAVKWTFGIEQARIKLGAPIQPCRRGTESGRVNRSDSLRRGTPGHTRRPIFVRLGLRRTPARVMARLVEAWCSSTPR